MKRFSRRKFIKTGSTLAAGLLAGCGGSNKSGSKTIKLGVSGYALQSFRKAIDELGFTAKTGFEVEILQRPNTPSELLTQMTSAIYAGTSPYDILNFEDEIALPFSRIGWLLPLDEIIPKDFWDDLTKPMFEMMRIWSQSKGETFRIANNFEPCYWWYRQDWFDEKGINIPQTWDEVKEMGKVFTDKKRGVWASEEGLIKRAFLNVYLAWITKQAGGNHFDIDETFETALQYIYDLMYKHDVLSPTCLQKNYDQQNGDYMGDRVAFMRQWPFFYDVTMQNKSWFSKEKVVCGFPPIGPAGEKNSTYAASWGLGIPKTAQNIEGAKKLLEFLIRKDIAPKLVDYSTWFLSARKSVLEKAGKSGSGKLLKMYIDADVIATRPYHLKYAEAVSIVEDVSSAFLSNQINLSTALKRAKEKLAQL